MKLTPRTYFFIGFIFCVMALLIAGYFQFIEDLEPCPLCISQRIGILLIAIILLIAVIHNPNRFGVRVYSILGFLGSLAGAAIAGRHIWLQNLPPEEVPTCGPGLEYILNNFPLIEAIKVLFSGTGECADVLWTFLGLSIPGWTLVAFAFLAVVTIIQFWNSTAVSSNH